MKKLCELKRREIEKRLDEIRGWVDKPKYICSHCARVAANKKRLCHPEPLHPEEDE